MYLVVHVSHYHGCVLPEKVECHYIHAPDGEQLTLTSAQRKVLMNYFGDDPAQIDDWYNLYIEDNPDHALMYPEKLDLVDWLLNDVDRFQDTNWSKVCTCEGCYETFYVIPNTEITFI